MDFLIKRVKPVYENASSMLLACALVYAFSALWSLKVSVFFILAVSLLTIVASLLLESTKNKVFAVIFPFMLVIFILLLCRLLNVKLSTHLRGLSDWTLSFFSAGGAYNALYAYFFAGILTVAASVLCRGLDRLYPARVLASAALCAGGILMSINKLDMPKFSVCVGMLYSLNLLIELVNKTVNRKIRRKDSRVFAVYLLPICMLTAVLAVLLPSREEPIQWSGVKRTATVLLNRAELLITEIQLLLDNGNGSYSVSFSGYSESSRKLGGIVLRNDGILLNIKALNRTRANLYLTGAVKNEYTGEDWKYTARDESLGMDEYELDFYELLNAFDRQGLPPDELKGIIERRSVLLTYDDVKTKTLFYPIKSYDFDLSQTRGANIAKTNLVFRRVKGRDTSYSVSFADVNYTGEAFQDLLRAMDGFRFDEEGGVSGNFVLFLKTFFGYNYPKAFSSEETFDSIFSRRAEQIRADYLSLPDTLPERVRTLSADLTKEYETSYEKLKALEAYLNTYRYTTTPQKIPAGRDFTDYFLFDGKEGYCTYFATAMAVMGRCIGIPTRYVDGAAVNYEYKLGDSLYKVPNNSAHAWAEAYLEGVGWIPFEPTSGFSENRYVRWPVQSSAASSSAPLTAPETFVPDTIPDTAAYPLPADLLSEGKEADYSRLYSALLVFLTAVFFVIAAFFAYYFIVRIRYEQKRKKADANRRLYFLFSEILYALRLLRFEMKPQDTVLTFAERVKDEFSFDGMTFLTPARIFMKVRYAQRDVTGEEFAQISAYMAGLENALLQKHGRVRMFFLKFQYYRQ